MRRTLALALTCAAVLAAGAGSAHAASRACSESGDVCLRTYVKDGARFIEAGYMERYLRRDKLCVRAPTGRQTCRTRRLTRTPGGIWRIRLRWRPSLLGEGPGVYRATRGGFPPAVTFRVR